ncbi:hypothetical protein [Uliginosibacterium flavum]|uniref:Uncharacterized protein n=1 Tax=Uliginosibacterium flavum TaxID=1396831 RepID=A0ABV2TP10_9RHOO
MIYKRCSAQTLGESNRWNSPSQTPHKTHIPLRAAPASGNYLLQHQSQHHFFAPNCSLFAFPVVIILQSAKWSISAIWLVRTHIFARELTMKQSLLIAALIALAVSACGKKEEAAVAVEASAPAVEASAVVEASAPAADMSAPVEASAPAADASAAK